MISGEPFMAQTEMDGYGRVLFMTKDVWPEFISCVLAVNENVIRQRRGEIQRLVDGIARSGKWLDQAMDHRMQAAEFAARQYYHQDPRLLQFVLSKPPDRVKYTNLSVRRPDFEEIEALGARRTSCKGPHTSKTMPIPRLCRTTRAFRPYDLRGPKMSLPNLAHPTFRPRKCPWARRGPGPTAADAGAVLLPLCVVVALLAVWHLAVRFPAARSFPRPSTSPAGSRNWSARVYC